MWFQVTCKVCGHESVRFDPFTFLSLPLPMESSVRIEIVGRWNSKFAYLTEVNFCSILLAMKIPP
jgi:ubiquitin C-terminal hydrolase